jgi:hypothetical protein
VKRIILNILFFLAVFLIFAFIFFPFDQAAKKALNTVINNYKIPVYYSDLNAGVSSAVITDAAIYYNGEMIGLGDINFKYSPLSLINRKISADMENGFVSLSAQNAKKAVNAEAALDVERISKLLGQSAAGRLKIDLSYEYASKSGAWEAVSDTFNFQTPFMAVAGKNLKMSGSIGNNIVTVQNFSCEGDFPITLDGQIRIDPVNIKATRINLNGEITLAGAPTPFALQGTLSAPKFSLR